MKIVGVGLLCCGIFIVFGFVIIFSFVMLLNVNALF